MQIQIGYKAGHHNAVSLIATDDFSFQVRPNRAIVIPKSGTSIKWRFTVSVLSLHIKQSEPLVLESRGMPSLRNKLPMSLTRK